MSFWYLDQTGWLNPIFLLHSYTIVLSYFSSSSFKSIFRYSWFINPICSQAYTGGRGSFSYMLLFPNPISNNYQFFLQRRLESCYTYFCNRWLVAVNCSISCLLLILNYENLRFSSQRFYVLNLSLSLKPQSYPFSCMILSSFFATDISYSAFILSQTCFKACNLLYVSFLFNNSSDFSISRLLAYFSIYIYFCSLNTFSTEFSYLLSWVN